MKPYHLILPVFGLLALVACPDNPVPPSAPTISFVSFRNTASNVVIPATTGVVPANFVAEVSSSDRNRVTDVQCFNGATAVTNGTAYRTACTYSGLTTPSVDLRAVATNSNSLTGTTTKTVVVDSTSPTLSPIALDGISSFVANPQKIIGTPITVTVSATDVPSSGTATTTVLLRLDGDIVQVSSGGTLSYLSKNLTLGSHTFVAEAYDAAGNLAAKTSQSLLIVNAPAQGAKPTLTLTPRTPATNGYYKGGTLLEFSWVASAATALTTFTPSSGGGSVGLASTTSLSDLNVWTLPTTSGNYNLKGVSQDATIPVPFTSDSVFLNASVDADAPVTEFTNVVANQNFNANPITINYISTDTLSGVRNVTLRAISGTTSTLVGINTAAIGSFTWTPSNGTYTLQLVTTDNVGNVAAPVTVGGVKVDVPTPDTTPPTVSIDTNSFPNPASGQIAVTVLASDLSGVAGVTLLVEGTPVATDSAAPYIFNLDTTLYQNGPISIQARATDLVGNVSGNTLPVTTTVANSRKPEFAITSPTNAATLSGLNKVTVNVAKRTTDYQITSPITVDVLDYRGKIVATRDISTASFSPTGELNIVQNTTDIDFNAFPVDAYVIRAKMTIDLAPIGTVSTGDGEMITQINISNNNQSNQPPALQILSPQRLNETQSILPVYVGTNGYVVADISDNTGVNSVELRMTCETGCGVSGPVNALQQYIAYIPPVTRAIAVLSFNANATPYLPDGTYVLRVVAQDSQGNRNIQEVKARIDRSVATTGYEPKATVLGASTLNKDEELCPGKVRFFVNPPLPGFPNDTLFKHVITSPTGKVYDSNLTKAPEREFTFDEKGTWNYLAQVQETIGLYRVTNVQLSIGASTRIPTLPATPCP